MNREWNEGIHEAAGIIAGAGALLISAGAGMGVDSGLPDFRGSQGFWNAYPPYKKLGLDFYDLANPDWFARDPELAWGFYGRLARPNVLMFGDWDWRPQRGREQALRLRDWLETLAGKRLAVIECGAGTAVPSVRRLSEQLLSRPGTRLVRINPREAEVPEGQVGLSGSALAALEAIAALMPGH